MKKQVFFAFLCLIMFISQSSIILCQNWQEMMDSTNYYKDMQSFDKALVWGNKALIQAEKEFGELDTNFINTIGNIAEIFYYADKTDSAITIQEYHLKLCRKFFNDDNPKLAQSINNLAVFFDATKRDDNRTEQLYIESLAMYRRIFKEDNNKLAESTFSLAFFYRERGKYDKADSLFAESLAMFRRLLKNDYIRLSKLINSVAMFYDSHREYRKAEPLYIESLELKRKVYISDHQDIVSSLSRLAVCYWNLVEYRKAELLYIEALDISKRLNKEANEITAKCALNLADLYENIGDIKKAEPLYNEALDMFRNIHLNNNPDLAQSIDNVGIFYSNIGNTDKALELLTEALEMRRRILPADYKKIANNLHSLAVLYKKKGNYDKSEVLHNESLSMFKMYYKTEHTDIAMCLDGLADLHYYKADFRKAEQFLIEAMEMRRRIFISDHIDLAKSLQNLATFYNHIGEYNKVEPLYIEALEMFWRIFKAPHTYIASVLNNLANYNNNISNLTKAEKLFIEAYEMARNIYTADHPDMAISILNTAAFYKSIGNFEKAEPLYEEAYQMFKRIYTIDNPAFATCINNTASFYHDKKLHLKAELLYTEALEMNRRLYTGDQIDIALSLNNIAFFYQDIGDYYKAEPLFIESLEMYRRIFKNDHNELAIAINNLGKFYSDVGKYNYAETLLIEALDMRRRLFKTDHPDLAKSINNMANFYIIKGEFDKADNLFNELFPMIENILNNYFPSLSESEKEKFLSTLNKYYDGYYSFIYKMNKESNQNYTSVYSNSLIQVYDNLLFTKGLLLNSTNKVIEQVMNSGDSSLIELYKSLNYNRNYIAMLYNMTKTELEQKQINLDSIINLTNNLEKELTRKSDVYANEFNNKKIRWKEVQNQLNPKEAAIELIRFRYYDNNFTDTIYYAALILKKDSRYPELVLLENGNELEEIHFLQYNIMIKDLSDEYRSNFNLTSEEAISDLLKEMYQNFWAKIQEKLDGIKTVYISVDGVFNKINLNTFINPATEKYLAEEMNIVLLTSTRDLVKKEFFAKDQSNAKKYVALFGNPKFNLDTSEIELLIDKHGRRELYYASNSNNKLRGFGNETLLRGLSYDELPSTQKEIEKMETLFANLGWEVTSKTGIEATEDEVKAVKNPRVLHISTHGQFDKHSNKDSDIFRDTKIFENPLLKSKLIFSGGENTRRRIINNEIFDNRIDDGYLTAYEVMNMNLDNTELVVLSACETGLGEIRNGEGVYGLQRAFMVAGAENLIMSLWKVPDLATQELMTEFYGKWLGGIDKREAFRQSQMQLAEKYTNFFYWGAWVLVGK